MIHLSLLQSAPTFLVAIILFILIIGFYLLGNLVRSRAVRKNPDLAKIDFGAINGMLLALLGLLLAFTFSMSNSRFDARRQLIIEESNNIGTVILRTDIYPDSVRQLLRSNLKEYVEQRIAFYQVGMNVEKAVSHYLKADSLGKVVWSIVASYAKVDNITTRTSEMIPALNAMIDITTTRRAAGESTIPDLIIYFLFLLCIGSAFLLGYEKPNHIDWIVVLGFGVMLSLTVYAIIDLDRPRSGLIDLDTPHQKIVELRDMFK
jgi:uncharacterized membrane protein (DUF485 family)